LHKEKHDNWRERDSSEMQPSFSNITYPHQYSHA